MNEANPYESPEVVNDVTTKRAPLGFGAYLLRGLFIGLGFGAAITPLHWMTDAVFLRDYIEDAIRDLGIGAVVGIVVGLVWGLFNLRRKVFARPQLQLPDESR